MNIFASNFPTAQKFPKKFPKKIPKNFQKNSKKIPKKVQKNSKKIPKKSEWKEPFYSMFMYWDLLVLKIWANTTRIKRISPIKSGVNKSVTLLLASPSAYAPGPNVIPEIIHVFSQKSRLTIRRVRINVCSRKSSCAVGKFEWDQSQIRLDAPPQITIFPMRSAMVKLLLQFIIAFITAILLPIAAHSIIFCQEATQMSKVSRQKYAPNPLHDEIWSSLKHIGISKISIR